MIIYLYSLSFYTTAYSRRRTFGPNAFQDSTIVVQASRDLEVARLNMGHNKDVIGYLEQQLGPLDQVYTLTVQHYRTRTLRHLGDCDWRKSRHELGSGYYSQGAGEQRASFFSGNAGSECVDLGIKKEWRVRDLSREATKISTAEDED